MTIMYAPVIPDMSSILPQASMQLRLPWIILLAVSNWV
eukprot:SAG22_NODE_7560_length_728_cov_2.286169_1_plen_37_part_10